MAITIIGIPLALANLKLIPVSLFPLGKEIVPSDPGCFARDVDRPSACPRSGHSRPIGRRARRRARCWIRYGRIATDLRVSLTDRCNLRCTYCMPAEGLDWLPGEELLRPDELARLMRIAVTRLGITNVRFTGGEPLVSRTPRGRHRGGRRRCSRGPETAMTTNGIGLARRAAGLKAAGLGPGQRLAGHRRRRALRPHHPSRPARTTCWTGLAAATAAGLAPVKVNAVLDPVTGLDDAVALLRFCLRARLSAAHHRADAAGRRPPVATRPDH